jgi:hypothetical protein
MLPGRRLLVEALLRKVAFPGRVEFRIGESRGDRERFHELVRAFVAAEVLGGPAWDDFILQASLFTELHLARAAYVERQLLTMAPLRLEPADWARLDEAAAAHLGSRRAGGENAQAPVLAPPGGSGATQQAGPVLRPVKPGAPAAPQTVPVSERFGHERPSALCTAVQRGEP